MLQKYRKSQLRKSTWFPPILSPPSLTLSLSLSLSLSLPTDSELFQPERKHPLPSYLDYKMNSSVRAYQTNYFSSHCADSPDTAGKVFEINLGAEMDTLGGACELDLDKRHYLNTFCDGPLKAKTAYRWA